MAHVIGMRLPLVGRLLADAGAVPSTRGAVLEALSSGATVLTFPGGDHETWRPFWQADRVDLAGRKGVLRLARRAGVPIVPLVIRGSHHTAPVLWRSRLLPWLAIWPKLARVRALPFSLSAALLGALTVWWLTPGWSWPAACAAGAAWALVPLTWSIPWVPATIRARLGPPLAPEVLVPDDAPETLDAAYDRLVSTMQAIMDDLARGR